MSIHPSYNPRNNAFDFALFRIEDVPNAVPVPLNRDALNPFDGEVLTAIGMGALDDITGRYPEVLQEVQVQAVSQAECSRVYGGWISSDMVCAGGHGYVQARRNGDWTTPAHILLLQPKRGRLVSHVRPIVGPLCRVWAHVVLLTVAEETVVVRSLMRRGHKSAWCPLAGNASRATDSRASTPECLKPLTGSRWRLVRWTQLSVGVKPRRTFLPPCPSRKRPLPPLAPCRVPFQRPPASHLQP